MTMLPAFSTIAAAEPAIASTATSASTCALNKVFRTRSSLPVGCTAKLPAVGRRIGRARKESSPRDSNREQPLLLRYPRAVLAIAALVLAALAVIGTGTEDRLDPTELDVPGTESSRGTEMLRAHFGETAPFAILLRGPAEAIDRQG